MDATHLQSRPRQFPKPRQNSTPLETSAFQHALLQVLHDNGANYVLLSNNGSILVRGVRLALPLDQYCMDVGAALVCTEDRVAVKCCPVGSVYEGTGCVADEALAAAAIVELHTIGEVVITERPQCSRDLHLTVVGALSGARLMDDGALELTEGEGVRVTEGAWCADAVRGSTSVQVLKCVATPPLQAKDP